MALFQSLFEVGKQIAPVFDAERDADQAIANTGFVEIFGAPRGMGSAARMAGERFDAAERNGIAG